MKHKFQIMKKVGLSLVYLPCLLYYCRTVVLVDNSVIVTWNMVPVVVIIIIVIIIVISTVKVFYALMRSPWKISSFEL
jgi:hypothetical protein